MTPSILKNVVRMPKQRMRQVRTRISYMTAEQLDRFLRAAKEYGPREHAMFLFAVAHGARAPGDMQSQAVRYQLQQRTRPYCPAEGIVAIHADVAQGEGQFPIR